MYKFIDKKIITQFIPYILIFSFVLSLVISCIGIPDFFDKMHLGKGELLIQKHLFKEAIAEFNKVVDNESLKNTIYADRAAAYYNLKDYEKALADCNSLIDINKNSWYAYYLKANIYFKRDDKEKALDNINIAINLAGGIIGNVYSTRAMIYCNLSRYYEALNDCDKAIGIDSSDSLAYKVRGTILLQAGQIDPSELEKSFINLNKAISLDPTDAEALYNRALAYIIQKKYAEAATDLEQALSLCQEQSDIEKIQQKMAEIQQ